ncbi:unnamed protein product, partial [Rotaria sp. Silwood2]
MKHPLQQLNNNTKEYLFGIKTATTNITSTIVQNNNNNHQMDIVDMFEKINNTMLYIKQQQDDLNEKFNTIVMKLNTHNNDIGRIKYCIYEIIYLFTTTSTLNNVLKEWEIRRQQTMEMLDIKSELSFLLLNTSSLKLYHYDLFESLNSLNVSVIVSNGTQDDKDTLTYFVELTYIFEENSE